MITFKYKECGGEVAYPLKFKEYGGDVYYYLTRNKYLKTLSI